MYLYFVCNETIADTIKIMACCTVMALLSFHITDCRLILSRYQLFLHSQFILEAKWQVQYRPFQLKKVPHLPNLLQIETMIMTIVAMCPHLPVNVILDHYRPIVQVSGVCPTDNDITQQIVVCQYLIQYLITIYQYQNCNYFISNWHCYISR